MQNIIGIKINLKNALLVDQSFLIELFKIEDGKKNIFYSEDILFEKNFTSKLIHLNFNVWVLVHIKDHLIQFNFSIINYFKFI